ncbi:MAG: diaminopimelate epimerase [Candidatus Actinomarinales bacterium]|nr:MAG: diaminopimelate epimerase [Candidatus Actinomarinales bacterium]|tara:strand:- start:4605 stop:5339 length:735 start_codon:yes stop_codon:yes gene_type:complete
MNNPQYMSGTGNNFLVSEYEKSKTDLEIISIVADSLIDIDGVIFVEKISSKTVKMYYYNNDGSTAELCVNGIRCVAKYAIDNSIVDSNELTVIAPIGNIKTISNGENISIEVTIPTYDQNKIIIDNNECIHSKIGNPHLLVQVKNVEKFNLEKFVNKVYQSKKFDNGVNIEIYNMIDKNIINARVHERGVGETDACGSGAICMFYYLYDTNQVNNNSIILYPGGELEMSIEKDIVTLSGKVTYL